MGGTNRRIDDAPMNPPAPREDGGNAPPFTPPSSIPGTNPAPVEQEGIRFNRVEPLPVDAPVAATYRALRQRVQLSAGPTSEPQIAARRLPAVNAGWVPAGRDPALASR